MSYVEQFFFSLKIRDSLCFYTTDAVAFFSIFYNFNDLVKLADVVMLTVDSNF